MSVETIMRGAVVVAIQKSMTEVEIVDLARRVVQEEVELRRAQAARALYERTVHSAARGA